MRIGSYTPEFSLRPGTRPSERTQRQANANGRQDRLVLNPWAKQNKGQKSSLGNLIESLNEQRENIRNYRSELIKTTTDKGEDLKTIKPMLEMLEEKLQTIEEQIGKAFADQQAAALSGNSKKADDKEEDTSAKPKTKEEAEASKLGNLAQVGVDLDRLKVMNRTKTAQTARLNVLKSEVKLDGALSITHSANSKQKEISALKSRIDQNTTTVADTLLSANSKIAKQVETYEKNKDTTPQAKEDPTLEARA